MNSIDKELVLSIIYTNNSILDFIEKNILNWYNITPNQFFILWKIISWDIKNINWLKSILNISPPALSQLLNRLESSWFIKRSFWKTKREINIKPTSKAIELQKNLEEKYIWKITEKFSEIKEKDKEIMIKFLEFIKNSL